MIWATVLRKNVIIVVAAIILVAVPLVSQTGPGQKLSFEVATIKPTAPDFRGRFATMQGAHQFVARNYTVKFMVATAYNVPPRSISGGPAWIDSDAYDILAATPGEVRPSVDEQMSMLRTLLADRFSLTFHREQRELPTYELTVINDGAKIKDTASPDEQPVLVNRVFPDHVLLPARNVTIAQFAAMFQRAVLDRHVVDKTGLPGKYDFDLKWTPDETQFGGQLPASSVDTPPKPDLFAAIQQQLGLRLRASRGPVDVIVIDRVGEAFGELTVLVVETTRSVIVLPFSHTKILREAIKSDRCLCENFY